MQVNWHTLLLAAMALICLPSCASTLAEIYDLALSNDPEWRVARSRHLETQELLPRAQGELLPQVSIAASRGIVSQSQLVAGRSAVRQSYMPESASITLRQSLIRVPQKFAIDEAIARGLEGNFTLLQEMQGLGVRVFSSYVDALNALENEKVSMQQMLLAEESLRKAMLALDVGQGSRIDVRRAESILKVEKTNLTQAEQMRALSKLRLEMLAGITLSAPKAFQETAWTSLAKELPAFEVALDTALAQNPKLLAAKESMNAQMSAYKAANSTTLPKLDLILQTGRSAGENSFFVETTTNSSQLLLQLSMTLYSGGIHESSTRRAAALLDQAAQRNEQIRNDLIFAVRAEYDALLLAKEKVESLEVSNAVEKAEIESLISGKERGIYSSYDVMLAQARQRKVKLELSSALHNYMVSWLRLQVYMGRDIGDAILALNKLLLVQ